MKKFFPIFTHHPNLIFLDSAASVQKPAFVLESIKHFSETNYANIHRGNYTLSLESTEKFEQAREKVSRFLGANKNQLIFTKNGTEASNIIAYSFLEKIKKDDEIIISISEHHANILPWMNICKKTGAKIIWVYPEKKTQVFSAEDFEKKLSCKTRCVVFAHVSNVTGQIFPIKEIQEKIKNFQEKNNCKIFTIVDACQSIPHIPFHFNEFSVDFAFFTGHKIGAGGTGGLLVSPKILENFSFLSPLLLGGNIIEDVNETEYSLSPPPEKFEAGTPNIEQVIGLSSAIDFLEQEKFSGGMKKVSQYGKQIIQYALKKFSNKLSNWKIIGPKDYSIRCGNISFYHPSIHHFDVGAYLSEKNIAVRTGFHCANPLHHWLNIPGTIRASFWVYTEKSDIDALVESLKEIEDIFG